MVVADAGIVGASGRRVWPVGLPRASGSRRARVMTSVGSGPRAYLLIELDPCLKGSMRNLPLPLIASAPRFDLARVLGANEKPGHPARTRLPSPRPRLNLAQRVSATSRRRSGGVEGK